MGFEPTCPLGQPHFECGSLRPLRYASMCPCGEQDDPATDRPVLWRCHPDLNRGMKVLQTFALPLGYVTMVKKRRLWRKRLFCFWSGRRGSNSLPPPWQGGALPDELRPQIILSVLDGFYIICIFPRFVKLKIRKISKASRASFFIHPSL